LKPACEVRVARHRSFPHASPHFAGDAHQQGGRASWRAIACN
jgi:hypothetical protein